MAKEDDQSELIAIVKRKDTNELVDNGAMSTSSKGSISNVVVPKEKGKVCCLIHLKERGRFSSPSPRQNERKISSKRVIIVGQATSDDEQRCRKRRLCRCGRGRR
ncbi:unnamed protein product [Linum trigynum]|uniref:Uncharacterized protein n=1 Tax=Linum trigynum TaxID=586398 RepID=A0AAV2CWM4_9ROSI